MIKTSTVFYYKSMLMEVLFEWQGRRCVYCQLKPVKKTIDHFIPLPSSDAMRINNLVVSCHCCNSRKYNKRFKTICSVQQYIYDQNNRERSGFTWPFPVYMPDLLEGLSAHSQVAEILQRPVPNHSFLDQENYRFAFGEEDYNRALKRYGGFSI